MIKNDTHSPPVEVKRLSIALIVLVNLAMLSIVLSVCYAAVCAKDEGWVFPLVEGEPPFDVQEMSLVDYEMLIVLLSLPDICWLYGLWSLHRMSRRFLRGEVLVAASVSYFIRFGYSLLAAAAIESMIVFMVIRFMIFRGYLSDQLSTWQYLFSGDGLLTGVGAVVVILTAWIFRAAVTLSEEAQLTI